MKKTDLSKNVVSMFNYKNDTTKQKTIDFVSKKININKDLVISNYKISNERLINLLTSLNNMTPFRGSLEKKNIEDCNWSCCLVSFQRKWDRTLKIIKQLKIKNLDTGNHLIFDL